VPQAPCTIRETPRTGPRPQLDALPTSALTAPAGQIITANSVGQTTQAVIAGTVYDDANASGAQDPGEAGVADRTVFLDANGNGQLDRAHLTTPTASNGAHTSGNITPGA